MNSILNSVKLKLGLSDDYDAFDYELIGDINSAFFVLWQLGVGRHPERPFTIQGGMEEWSDFVDDGDIDICKTYVAMRVRLLFDPPSNSFLVENINKQIQEFEQRMVYTVDARNAGKTGGVA